MASLEHFNDRFRIVFRYAGRRYQHPGRIAGEWETNAVRERLEESRLPRTAEFSANHQHTPITWASHAAAPVSRDRGKSRLITTGEPEMPCRFDTNQGRRDMADDLPNLGARFRNARKRAEFGLAATHIARRGVSTARRCTVAAVARPRGSSVSPN